MTVTLIQVPRSEQKVLEDVDQVIINEHRKEVFVWVKGIPQPERFSTETFYRMEVET